MNIRTALVVEDDARLATELCGALTEELGVEAYHCADLASAEALLEARRPDLLVLDVCLPDGRADDLVELLHRAPPFPITIAISGRDQAEAAFRLGGLGVDAYLRKPFGLDALISAVRDAVDARPDLSVGARAAVGRAPLRDVEGQVRRTMIDEALRRTGGNVSRSARLLGVSRQFVQHVIRGMRED